jgi:putative sporulation protein YyaC
MVMNLIGLDNFEKTLKRKLQGIDNNELLFVCIGTNENIADSIGPIIGSNLKEKLGKSMVLGDKHYNIKNKYDLMYQYFKIKKKTIIAVDAAVLKANIKKENFLKDNIEEEIFIRNGSINMGLALGENKGTIGDISIKIAIRNLDIEDEYYINHFAKRISDSIVKVIKEEKL